MATPHQKLAASLAALQQLQRDGRRVFRSGELSRLHRERLLRNGFLQEVMKGWLIASSPGSAPGESTPWYASFWEFCARYCEARFGNRWHLSPEQSFSLHAANTVVPAQVVVHSPEAGNNKTDLLFGTSLYDLKTPRLPEDADLVVRDGLRLYSPAASLVRVSDSFLRRRPMETRVVIAGIRDGSDLLRALLQGGHTVVAGRLAGALRRFGDAALADQLIATMRAAGYEAKETDLFAGHPPAERLSPSDPPIVGRLRAMWEQMRGGVLDALPAAPGLPGRPSGYMRILDEIYSRDAYHSLSIEGYVVTPALVERVRAGGWNPARQAAGQRDRDALAARGYWQAYQQVKRDVTDVLGGARPGALVRVRHRDWYRELFQPFVAAGLLAPAVLAGYRTDAVYLRTSRYVPPRWEGVRDAMPAFFDLLEQEPAPAVRAVLGHWMFGYIHPYPDGNGRLARFLMNTMLASGGYPWTMIRAEDREPYLRALDRASIDLDIGPFAAFIARRVRAISRVVAF